MKTIAVIGTRGFPGIQGGVEMHCENIYPFFSSDMKLRVYRRKPYLTQYSNKDYPNIEFIDLPSTRIKGLEAVLHTFLCVMHILFHRKPQAVHVHNIGPGMFTPLLRLMGLKVVMTYHSANYEHAKWGRLARTLLRLCESISLRCSHRIIFVNKFQMQKYSTRVQKKSIYIANGIHRVTRTPDKQFLEKHGIASGEYLLGVGRLTPEKGFEYLVQAASSLPNVKQVVIAGNSDHDTTYYEQLKALDNAHKVIFTGYTTGEDLRQLYSHARMFVLSSVVEGFPLVMLEAMSYGLPLVVSDIPASHLVELPHDRYFECRNAQSLAQVLEKHLADDAPSYQYRLDDYHWPLIAQRTEAVFHQLTQ